MKKLTFIFAIVFSIAFTSCKKDIENPDTTPDTMEELVVPATFDWKTTKDIQLSITGNTNGIVEVASPQGSAYQKAFLTANQAYNMKLTVPSYEKTVRLKYQGQDVSLELTASELSYSFN